jgi:hypothetical protein
MLGDYKKAAEQFRTAAKLFTKTKDPRGLVYCSLGLGEIALLEGRRAAAEKYIGGSVDNASRYGFRVEKCHAEMVRSYMTGKVKAGCYGRLGLRLHFNEAPFNIP